MKTQNNIRVEINSDGNPVVKSVGVDMSPVSKQLLSELETLQGEFYAENRKMAETVLASGPRSNLKSFENAMAVILNKMKNVSKRLQEA